MYMKNKLIKLSALFTCSLVIVFSTGCKKAFLDQKPYNSVVLSEAIKNEADLNTALNGLYASLRVTDLYGRTYAVKGDMMGDKCFLSSSNSGRYLVFNNYNFNKTDGYASAVWRNSYNAIKNANFIINCGLDPATNDNYSQFFAEAYAVRALVYFDLVRNYALPYTVDPATPGVPIVTKFDLTSKPARATVAQVYEQIITDLTKAFSLAKFNQGQTMNLTSVAKTRSVNSSFLSKYAIELLLARVYQNKGDWASAKTAALDVINNSGFSLVPAASVIAYWKGVTPSTSKVETMFELTNDANNQIGDGTMAQYLVPKANGGAYGDMLATKAFYDSYRATDVRKGLISPSTRSGQLGTAHYIVKYPIETVNWDDMKILRFSEAYLILAEAYYNQNDIVNANLTLNNFAVKRDPAIVYASTGTAVLDDILNERAKEFAFEGYRFYDLIRLNKPFTKSQEQDAANTITKSTAVDLTNINIIFPIPSDEILVNPNLTQNRGY